jgi:hypothetical protein
MVNDFLEQGVFNRDRFEAGAEWWISNNPKMKTRRIGVVSSVKICFDRL